MKHERVRGVYGVWAVNPTDGNHADGWRLLFHDTDLDRAGLTTQHEAARQVEIIEGIPSWMGIWNVEGIEVVKHIFDLWTTGNRESKATEEVDQLGGGLGQWMKMSEPRCTSR